VHCEAIADALQDLMAEPFQNPGKHDAKTWQIFCENLLFHAQRYTARCSLDSTFYQQMCSENQDLNHVLHGFYNLILHLADSF
jgi:hypothetical protein